MKSLKVLQGYLFKNLTKSSIRREFCSVLSTDFDRKEITNQNNNRNLIDPRKVSPLYVLKPNESLDFEAVHRILPPTFNLAAYANKSEVIRRLAELGVELYKIEKKVDLAEYILKLDFKKDIVPIIQFLHDIGVDPDDLGPVISKNSAILKESVDDLDVRINYLKSKKFTKEMIVKIVTEFPSWLSDPVVETDKKLGILQQTFRLHGDQVREMVTKFPRVISIPNRNILASKFVFSEEMGFDNHDMRKIILHNPAYLRADATAIMGIFDYVTRDMNIPKDFISKQPIIFSCKKFKIKQRDQFLKFIGRAQYNSEMPGYVSLEEIAIEDDAEFCEKVAKISVQTYNEFLKSLF